MSMTMTWQPRIVEGVAPDGRSLFWTYLTSTRVGSLGGEHRESLSRPVEDESSALPTLDAALDDIEKQLKTRVRDGEPIRWESETVNSVAAGIAAIRANPATQPHHPLKDPPPGLREP